MDMVLPLTDLGSRHPGLTIAIGQGYFEAACVCLSRHHSPPEKLNAAVYGETTQCQANWTPPDPQTLRAWANDIDATEAGAYCVALATIELLTGLVAISRAETLTGADYYLAPVGSDPDDLEACIRLEVSGVDQGGKSTVEARLRSKLKQASKGQSNLPAIASVVGFKDQLIAIAKLVEAA